MEFRVTASYPIAGDRPSDAELERLERRLQAASPNGAARVALSITALEVALTVESDRQVDAIAQAVGLADEVVGDASTGASAQPIPLPGAVDA
jgi:hypothetical protein